jgi:hypothetical protein
MIILFTDMFQSSADGSEEALFNALQHLKHNKHKVVLFHVVDNKTELNFDFDNAPRKFIDVETGEEVAVLPIQSKKNMKNRWKVTLKN